MIIHGNAIEKIKELPDNSVDAIVTDPPYGLDWRVGRIWKYKGMPQIFGLVSSSYTRSGK